MWFRHQSSRWSKLLPRVSYARKMHNSPIKSMNHQHAKPRLRGISSRNFKYGRPATQLTVWSFTWSILLINWTIPGIVLQHMKTFENTCLVFQKKPLLFSTDIIMLQYVRPSAAWQSFKNCAYTTQYGQYQCIVLSFSYTSNNLRAFGTTTWVATILDQIYK